MVTLHTDSTPYPCNKVQYNMEYGVGGKTVKAEEYEIVSKERSHALGLQVYQLEGK